MLHEIHETPSKRKTDYHRFLNLILNLVQCRHDGTHEIDNINNTISGHFHFDAYNASGEYTINISDGVFYKIPVNLGVQD